MLAGYVRMLVPNRTDADDLLQETKIALWRSFDRFEIGSSFAAWSRRTALHRVLNHRRQKGRERVGSGLSAAALEALSAEIGSMSERAETVSDHLNSCLQRLPTHQREAIRLRYYHGLTLSEVAERVRRTETATQRWLSRIRGSLRECLAERRRFVADTAGSREPGTLT